MAKGDRIDVVYRTGGGITTGSIVASQNGRRVELESEKDLNLGWIVAKEVTRGGTTVREKRFLASEVLAIEVEWKEMK